MSRTIQAGLELGIEADDGSRDDRIFARQQRAKRGKKAEPPVMGDGSCCGRCAWWSAPWPGESFGVCQRLVLFRGSESKVMATKDVVRMTGGGFEPLRTVAGYAGCRGFGLTRDEEAA